MYINDVIRLVRNYNPSEYGVSEMYQWCNEVSAMLAVETRTTYREIRPPIASDGSVLLPEGVAYENIVHVYADGHGVPKSLYRLQGRRCYIEGDEHPTDVVIVYEEPYYPIRMPKYIGDMTVSGSTIKITGCDFIVGDLLNITVGTTVLTDIPLMAIEGDPNDLTKYILTLTDTTGLSTTDAAVITRTVTEKTVCDAPFDTMYVDYLMAKIALYQKDTTSYNTYISQFNTKLVQYKEWLAARMPTEPYKFRNYW